MPFIPTSYQIETVAGRAIRQYPEHTAYIERAADLVTRGHIEWLGDKWACFSQAHANSYYTVNGVGKAACSCPSFGSRHVPIMRGYKYCKHRLAYMIYKDILLSQLNNRLVGNMKFKHEAARAQANERMLILYNDNNGTVGAFNERKDRVTTTICAVREKNGRMHFRSDNDMFLFSEWLHKARDLPTDMEMAIEDFVNPEDYYAFLRSQGETPEDAAHLVDNSIGILPDDIDPDCDSTYVSDWIPQI